MERLAEFEHHVVGYVDHVVDRPLPYFGEGFRQPLGRRTDLDAADDRRGVPWTKVWVFHNDSGERPDFLIARWVVGAGLAQFGAGECRDLPGHPHYAEAIGAIRGQLKFENGVADNLAQRSPNFGIGVQDENPLVVFTEAKFFF